MISTETQNKSITQPRTSIPLVDKSIKNGRNMPSIIFIENVEDYSDKYGHDLIVEDLNTYHG